MRTNQPTMAITVTNINDSQWQRNGVTAIGNDNNIRRLLTIETILILTMTVLLMPATWRQWQPMLRNY